MSKQSKRQIPAANVGTTTIPWPSIVALFLVLVVNTGLCFSITEFSSAPAVGDEPTGALRETVIGYGGERIFGGHEIEHGEYPFLVSIDKRCAGSIIGPRHILTSAECVNNYYSLEHNWFVIPLIQMEVFIGEHNREVRGDGEQNVTIVDLKIHPKYDRTKGKVNNIALLTTKKEIKYTTNSSTIAGGRGAIGPIELRCDPVPDESRLTVVSWGATSYVDGRPFASQVPMKLAVRHVPNDMCECYMKKERMSVPPPKTLCAAPDTKNQGSICDGDSGAPLILKGPKGYELVGIASLYKKPCGLAQFPAVYTNISDYFTWIIDNRS
uniref:Acrosin n=1 Tax=Aceria tosichella TaxID=561515 RepID=A0A6G1S998_9ACAR